MESSQPHASHNSHASSATGTNDLQTAFIETLEHRRFVEFCEACRRYRYIGLCFGTPGVGKTLSARRFSRTELVASHDLSRQGPLYGLPIDSALFTSPVVNTPAQVNSGIRKIRDRLTDLARSPVRLQAKTALGTIHIRNENYRRAHPDHVSLPYPSDPLPLRPTFYEACNEWEEKTNAIKDPTTLVLVDEADRLRTDSLEQLRALFDEGAFGLVLIGMLGLEKRMARYPQLYSRIGFVHEFQPLALPEMRSLLSRRWRPAGISQQGEQIAEDVMSAILRITGGNFRLLTRLLTQIERILQINNLTQLSKQVVEAARESLVIGST